MQLFSNIIRHFRKAMSLPLFYLHFLFMYNSNDDDYDDNDDNVD